MSCCGDPARRPGAKARLTAGASTWEVVDVEVDPCEVLVDGLAPGDAVVLAYAWRDGMVCEADA